MISYILFDCWLFLICSGQDLVPELPYLCIRRNICRDVTAGVNFLLRGCLGDAWGRTTHDKTEVKVEVKVGEQ
jgi:hypothetical protein